jgi:hypothetical protein
MQLNELKLLNLSQIVTLIYRDRLTFPRKCMNFQVRYKFISSEIHTFLYSPQTLSINFTLNIWMHSPYYESVGVMLIEVFVISCVLKVKIQYVFSGEG